MSSVASVLACALVGVQGARFARKGASGPTIAGVPVLNSELASDRSGVPHWVLVAKEGSMSDNELETLCGGLGSACERFGHPNQGGVSYLEVVGAEEDLEAVVGPVAEKLEFIEPVPMAHALPTFPSEQRASKSWGLDRVGVSERHPGAGKNAHIYVLDTGIRVSHKDFGGRAVPTVDMSVGPLKECDGDSSCAGDKQGHGTHCAGTAAGEEYGVASKATIHAVKVLSDRGSGSWSWSYDALDWLARKAEKPAVASMSLGGRGALQGMKVAVDAAVTSGVVVVVAGGNENSDSCRFSPAFVPSAITVGSTTSSDTRSRFSNYGSCTDIWAPGSDITSASHRSDSGSATFSGTSMACPHVSGAAALLMTGKGIKPDVVLKKLLDDAEDGKITGLTSSDTNKMLWVGN